MDSGPAAAPGVPMCFQHPQRETYLRCNRCSRPICTDCMVTASVGFHCPECVREANRDVRQVRTSTGGKRSARPGVVTMTLIGICVVMFGLQNLIGPSFTYRTNLIAMAPSVGALPSSSNIGVAYGFGEWYRLITSMFVHENIWHLGTNMLSLYWIGIPVESRLGRVRYLLTYLTCGIVGAAVSYAFLSWNASSLGASGAIFGLLGVLTVLALREKLNIQPIITVILLNLAFDFAIPGIDWHAHLGGLGAGLLLGAALAYAPRRPGLTRWLSKPQNYLPTLTGVALLALSAIIVLVHSQSLQDSSGFAAAVVHTVIAGYPQNT
jgi:membrane associated rhomboid family serine protease